MEKKGRLLSQGNTAEIYEWDTGKILKLYRKGLPEALCRYEFAVTKGVYNLLQIVPKPFEIVYVNDRIGAVYEQIQGKTMLKTILSKPWAFKRYARMLALYHIRIQKPVDFILPTVKEKLKRDIEATLLLSDTEKQRIYSYINALPDGDTICHFDFHPDNIMVLADQYRVIDWMTGCIGDPLSDVARTALILNYAEIPRAPFWVNMLAGIFQKGICKAYLSEYLKLSGAAISDIQRWEMPLAAARLRERISDSESERLIQLVKRKLGEQIDIPTSKIF
jgi:hypothetical protein